MTLLDAWSNYPDGTDSVSLRRDNGEWVVLHTRDPLWEPPIMQEVARGTGAQVLSSLKQLIDSGAPSIYVKITRHCLPLLKLDGEAADTAGALLEDWSGTWPDLVAAALKVTEPREAVQQQE